MFFRCFAFALFLALSVAPPARAQSAQEYSDWLAWCQRQGGRDVGGPNRPHCVFDNGGGSGGGEDGGGTPAIIQWFINRDLAREARRLDYNELIERARLAAEAGNIAAFNEIAAQARPTRGETRRRLTVWIRNMNWNHWLNLSNIAVADLRYADAQRYYERMRDYSADGADRRWLNDRIDQMRAAIIWDRARTLAGARARLTLYERAIDITPDIATPDGLAMVAWLRGMAAEEDGNLRLAVRRYRTALAMPFNDTENNRSSLADLERRLERPLRTTTEAVAAMDSRGREDEGEVIRSVESTILDWDRRERGRVIEAMDLIVLDQPNSSPRSVISEAWGRMYGTAGRTDLAAAAAAGDGPNLAASGRQSGEDCAVHAIATASGRSYDEVAAVASAIIRRGTYRPAFQREDPRGVLHLEGLNAAELILLAEALGEVEIVPADRFSATLRRGRPVTVGVWVATYDMVGGVVSNGVERHQILLSRTFELDRKTWFEVIDSNHDAPFYLSLEDLNVIQMENGLAYRQETRREPHLLQ